MFGKYAAFIYMTLAALWAMRRRRDDDDEFMATGSSQWSPRREPRLDVAKEESPSRNSDRKDMTMKFANAEESEDVVQSMATGESNKSHVQNIDRQA